MIPRGRLIRLAMVALGLLASTPAAAQDGAYGRLAGDASVAVEVGASETLGPKAWAGESLALRANLFYVHTVGLVVLYDESFGLEAQPTRRSVAGALEIRPLFLGRFGRNMEQGPAWADLTLDSIGLSLGAWGGWPQPRFCPPRSCPLDYGMQAGLGINLPLWAAASSAYVGLRAQMRWALSEPSDVPPPVGMLTLTLGYSHVFGLGLVDAGDALEP